MDRSRGRTALMDAAAGPAPPALAPTATSLPRLASNGGGARDSHGHVGGWSPDAEASPEGRAACTTLLLNAGASATLSTVAGLTPLMLAARCGGRGGLLVADVLIARCRGDTFKISSLVDAQARGAERGAAALHLVGPLMHVVFATSQDDV
jgi:ankyrin repeat protein